MCNYTYKEQKRYDYSSLIQHSTLKEFNDLDKIKRKNSKLLASDRHCRCLLFHVTGVGETNRTKNHKEAWYSPLCTEMKPASRLL